MERTWPGAQQRKSHRRRTKVKALNRILTRMQKVSEGAQMLTPHAPPSAADPWNRLSIVEIFCSCITPGIHHLKLVTLLFTRCAVSTLRAPLSIAHLDSTAAQLNGVEVPIVHRILETHTLYVVHLFPSYGCVENGG